MSKRIARLFELHTAAPEVGKLSSVVVVHVGAGHFDFRIARRLPWEYYQGRHAKAKRNKDGWSVFVDCPPLFHARLTWHSR